MVMCIQPWFFYRPLEIGQGFRLAPDRHQCNRCGDELGLFDGDNKVADGALGHLLVEKKVAAARGPLQG